MNTRGAAALGVGAIAFAVVLGVSTGPQTFTRVFTLAPIAGTGSSGSVLSFHPDSDDGDFGDCSDGDIIFTVDTSLARDVYYRNATINAGVTVKTASFAFRVCQTLTFVDAASNLSDSGNNGNAPSIFVFGGAGGAGIARQTLSGSKAGGAGGNAGTCASSDATGGVSSAPSSLPPPRFSTTPVSAGAGGAGNFGTGGSGSTGGIGQGGSGGGGSGGNSGCVGRAGAVALANAAGFLSEGDPRYIYQGMTGTTLNTPGSNWDEVEGGNGGGAGNVDGGSDAGGGGGSSGGWMVVGVRTIAGPGSIRDVGGNGGNGGSTGGGGGGGGSGGVLVIKTESYPWNNATVAGGTGGTGGTHGGNGGAGGPGLLTINYVRQP